MRVHSLLCSKKKMERPGELCQMEDIQMEEDREKHLSPKVSNAHFEHTLSTSVFSLVLVMCIQIASQRRS